MQRLHPSVVALIIHGSVGCQPSFDRRASRIDEPRLLAVQAEPAEVKPGDTTQLRVLFVTPNGPDPQTRVAWAFCTRQHPVADNNAVAADCLSTNASWITPIGRAAAAESIAATLPTNGCARFGPEPPPAAAGEPPIRPTDPDGTGGYYQPTRALVDDSDLVAFGRVRLSCDLPFAPAEIARAYRENYQPNRNPEIETFVAAAPIANTGEPISLSLQLLGGAAEPFVVYDPETTSLRNATETLEIAWHSTDGSFAHEISTADGSRATDNVWTAPEVTGTVYLWAVVRDDRGGVDFASLSIDVR